MGEWKHGMCLIFWMKLHQHKWALNNCCLCVFVYVLLFFLEKSCFIFVWNHLNYLWVEIIFSCFKFNEFFLKITPLTIKIDCRVKFLEKIVLQSICCFKKRKVFNSRLIAKPPSFLHSESNVTLYLFIKLSKYE